MATESTLVNPSVYITYRSHQTQLVMLPSYHATKL